MSQVKSPLQRGRPFGAGEPVAVRALAALLPLVLIVLLVGPAAAVNSSAFRAVAVAVHRYDGAAVTRATALFDVRDSSADQGPRVEATYPQSFHSGYDNLSQPARASARLAGYRLAPNTTRVGSAALPNIPEGATVRVLKPSPSGGAQYGVEYRWTTSQGQTARFRVHGPDATAPAGSNAASGEVYRYQIGSRYMGPDGTLRPSGISNPKSPFYDPVATNETHIPWPGFPQLWGGG